MVFDSSNGIYRSIFAAIAGLVLAANAQPVSQDTGSKPTTTQREGNAAKKPDVASSISRIGDALEAQNATGDPYEKEQNEREIRDLQAQEKSAYWAEAMFWATSVAVILSVIGIGLVWTTFRETQQANVIARNAQRAWVTLKAKPELIRRSEGYGMYIRATFVAENIGATAATEFDICHAVLFKGQTEKTDSIMDRIDEHIEEWRADYGDMGSSYLLPKDTETSDLWDTFNAEEIKWWEGVPVIGKAARPMLLCAVFYKTVDHPNVVQLSWRAWYLNTFDSDGAQMTLVPFNNIPLSAEKMCADPFHSSLVHTEYRVSQPEKAK
jgi:hypothetical protein